MSDRQETDDTLEAIARAAAELVPALTERLERHGLGEIEVSHGELHLRVAAAPGARAATTATRTDAHGDEAAAVPASTTGAPSNPGPAAQDAGIAEPSGLGVTSPAVGFFLYADGLGPGLSVAKGDPLGHVEMLGVRHDVRAPRGGTVRHLVAESGEAVEYGQVVVELEPAEAGR